MTFQQLPTTQRGDAGEAIADSYFAAQGWHVYSPPIGPAHPIDRVLMTEHGVFAVDVKTYPRQYSRPCTGIDTGDHEKYLTIEATGLPVVLFFIDAFEGCIYSGRLSRLKAAAKHHSGKTYYPLQLMTFTRRLTAKELSDLAQPQDSRYQLTRPFFAINKPATDAD
ncbi:NERD domain-containing protein [Neolewinella aurantiaca]|uniref:NERD domain-containing protein n=1 Tax=Neolewinella aurantiaca TaxID=2602767 RepID=A0A5C7FWX9_9BACT|nr:nuclease-related domain-containing protein [Neolewinella aurantiaca]TXF91214.1 NERD domain-containing protein [Neolewinella aurantiaca]